MMQKILKEWKKFLIIEKNYNVFRGTDKDLSVSDFDLEKTIEFGFHFGSEQSAKHRGTSKQDNFYLKKYIIAIDNPLFLDDAMRWSLESVIEQMIIKGILSKEEGQNKLIELSNLAKGLARKNYSSLVKEKNLILKNYLDELGYDGIIYENKGEAGDKAFIVWNNKQIQEIP
jgi:hypothetical protein